MTEDPRLTALATRLPSTVPFVGPEAQERSRQAPFIARLGANESGFGPSPLAIKAIQEAAQDAWKYGDPEAYDLRVSLAAHHGIDAKNIMIGEGIDGLLGLLCRLCLDHGDHVVTSAGAYPTLNYHAAGFGATIHTVPYAGDFEDPDRLIIKARETKAKLLYFANPDNPMGSWHGADTLKNMIKHVPDGTLLVLDEAYVDLAPDGTAPPLDPDNDRVIRMRTFSKGYGLAGIRVGYAIGSKPLINAFNKVRNHFGISRISQTAALAALSDQDWLTEVVNKVQTARARLSTIALDNKLRPLPSATNFVTMDCGHDGAHARAILEGLGDRGIFVRMPFVTPQDRCIRVSCAPPHELDAFANALSDVLAT